MIDWAAAFTRAGGRNKNISARYDPIRTQRAVVSSRSNVHRLKQFFFGARPGRPFDIAKSHVLEFEPGRLSIQRPSPGWFPAPTRSARPVLPSSRAACYAPRLHAPRVTRNREKIVGSVTVLWLSTVSRPAAVVRQVRLDGSSGASPPYRFRPRQGPRSYRDLRGSLGCQIRVSFLRMKNPFPWSIFGSPERAA